MPTTITRIQKTRLGRFSLYGEEGFLFSLDSETYFSCGVEEGDTLTCRGLGKCVLTAVGGTSKRGRIILTLARYI